MKRLFLASLVLLLPLLWADPAAAADPPSTQFYEYTTPDEDQIIECFGEQISVGAGTVWTQTRETERAGKYFYVSQYKYEAVGVGLISGTVYYLSDQERVTYAGATYHDDVTSDQWTGVFTIRSSDGGMLAHWTRSTHYFYGNDGSFQFNHRSYHGLRCEFDERWHYVDTPNPQA